jgi:PAS domain S-box-containing protein
MNEQLAEVSEHDELVMLRNAVHAANNVVLITDPNLPDNPIIYVNCGFEALTRYRQGEVLGQNRRFLQGRDRQQREVDELREAIRERRSVRVELRNYRKDGTLFWKELYVTLADVAGGDKRARSGGHHRGAARAAGAAHPLRQRGVFQDDGLRGGRGDR